MRSTPLPSVGGCCQRGLEPERRLSDNARAVTAQRSQFFIEVRHRARLVRKDPAATVNATVRVLACTIYLMVTEGQEYIEKGIEA